MTDHTMEEKRNHAVLVGLHASSLSQEENASDATLEELEALLETAGGVCVGSVLQNRETPEARTFIGEGKVAEVAALVQAHAQNRVPMLAQGLVHGEVGLGAGVGLHIGIIGAEELLGPLNGDVLHHVHALTAAVVALAGIALGVLVGQDGTGGGQNGGTDDVLRGDQLNVLLLPVILGADGLPHLGIGGSDKVHDFVDHGKHSFFWYLGREIEGGFAGAAPCGRPSVKRFGDTGGYAGFVCSIIPDTKEITMKLWKIFWRTRRISQWGMI